MLHYFKFRQDLFDPQPARDVYVKRPPGRGWPEECPPVRAANGFGWDLLANFDITFVRDADGGWRTDDEIELTSDFAWAPGDGEGAPLTQAYAWFWERGQTLPHPIDDHVWAALRHQVKVQTFLFLETDPNELLLMTEVPNRDDRPWRAVSAVIEPDWYPASYPWHCVLELPREGARVTIARGEPLCRLIPVRRDTYFARPMSPARFDELFARGQDWLATHGRAPASPPAARGQGPAGKRGKRGKPAAAPPPDTLDITRTYGKQQVRSRFLVEGGGPRPGA